jgi:hypothetical protein
VELLFVNASRVSEFEPAFGNLVQQRAGALLVSGDGFLHTHRDEIVALAERHAVAAIYSMREYVTAAGSLAMERTILRLGGKLVCIPAGS